MECLSLGREFVLDFDPKKMEVREDGRWELGLLMVTNEEIMICAHSKRGRAFVKLADGSLFHARPAAAFSAWWVGIRRKDGSLQEVYQRSTGIVEMRVTGI